MENVLSLIIAWIIIAIIVVISIIAVISLVRFLWRTFNKSKEEKLQKMCVSQQAEGDRSALVIDMSPILNIIAIVELLLWFLSFGLYDGLLLPRLRKADALRELKALEEGLAEAKSPEEVFAMCKHQPPLSLQFQKSEKVLWVIPDCRYLKVKKHVNISGPSVYGLEMRLEYGIGRLGASLSEYESLERADVGTVVLTTSHMYFQGQDMERFRVRLDKLASVGIADDHADRFMFQRDSEGSRPECFESESKFESMTCARTLDKLLLWLKDLELVGEAHPEDSGE